MYLKAAAQCAVQQPFLCGDDSIRFGTELRGRSVLFLQKRDCFWQNREFSTNKLGLLTIYKSVIVPNTDNMKGLEAAAAAGIVAGKQEKKLEVIADVTPEQTKAIRAYLDQTDIKVQHVENGVTFDIILTVWKGEHSAQVRIAVFHTNIVYVEKDGEVLVDIPVHGDSEETLTDRSLLEMAQVFRVPFPRVLRSIYVPQVLPYFRAAADTALGLSWKAGTAAEVIGLCSGTIGERLYTAKVYFQTADLFAWTAVIVLLSVLFEGLFLRGVDALTERWCA